MFVFIGFTCQMGLILFYFKNNGVLYNIPLSYCETIVNYHFQSKFLHYNICISLFQMSTFITIPITYQTYLVLLKLRPLTSILPFLGVPIQIIFGDIEPGYGDASERTTSASEGFARTLHQRCSGKSL